MVLRVSAVHDRHGTYYLTDRAATPGRWSGRSAPPLGLAGPVSPAELASVLSGRHPGTGAQMARRSVTCTAYDLTFAAPKSVSVIAALGAPEVASVVLEAQRSGVDQALGYLEDRAVAVRRGGGDGRSLLVVDGVLAAAFTHQVSRALDPHLHTHVVVANLARGADGRWTAIDGRGLFAHAGAAGALYTAHLRGELTRRLAVEWGARLNGRLEIDGIGPMVIGGFSGRRAEIGEHLAGVGRSGRRARHVAWVATRPAKDAGSLPGPEAWRSRAADLGFGRDELEAVTGRTRATQAGIDEHRFSAALGTGPDPEVPRRAVVQAWSEALTSGAAATDILGSVDQWAPAAAGEVGVEEREHRRSALLVPGHLLALLGPRPSTPGAQHTWRAAAADIHAFRARWEVTDPELALGVRPSGPDLTELPVRRLADHLATVRRIEDAARCLGRSIGREPDGRQLGPER